MTWWAWIISLLLFGYCLAEIEKLLKRIVALLEELNGRVGCGRPPVE